MMGSESEHIFHIALARDWEAAREAGDYRISTLGATLDEVGFIHGAFRRQVERIGSFLFADVTEPLTVLEVDAQLLSAAVRIENLEGGTELFPHFYGPVPVSAVVATIPARIVGRRFVADWDADR